jgi:hypothetical protein
MSTPYPIGVFTGNADATAQAAMTAFTNIMGAPPLFFNAFTDFTQAPDAWAGNTNWFAGVAASAPGYKPPMIPLIHLPTFSTNSGAPSTAQILANYADGAYDGMIQSFVSEWANQGYKTQYYRVGVEMNLSDGTYTYEGLQPQWVAAFKHIAVTLKAAFKAQGVTGKVVWNPGCAGGQLSGDIRTTMWSGSAQDMGADLIGGDCYDAWVNWASDKDALIASVNGLDWKTAAYPTKLEAFYDTLEDTSGTAFTLPVMIAFAKAQGLPICLPETGCGSGPSDNPWFVRWLRHKLDGATAEGVTVDHLSVWDSDSNVSDLFTDGSKPNEAAAWAYYFGVNAAAAPVVTPPATPVHAASPANTQINGPNGEIWDTNGAAWTITTGQQLAVNGTAEPSSADVVTMFWTGTGLLQLNTAGQWWTQPLTGGPGVATTQPADYKVPVAAPTIMSTTALPQSKFTLYLSADEYQGNADCQIAVDGKVVATNLPVTALHGSNQEQAFTWFGNYGKGSHTVTAEFLNDDYGGSSAKDRNLYFCGLTVDGTNYTSATSELPSTGNTVSVKVTTLY